MFENINNLLPRVFNKYGISDGISSVLIINSMKPILEENFSPEIMSHLEITSVKNGAINIRVSSSIIANEIQLKTDILIDQINEKMGKMSVKRINFKV